MKKSIVIFASTSGIAQAVAEEFLRKKYKIILCARDEDAIKRQVQDLEIKTDIKIPYIIWDLNDMDEHTKKTDELFEKYSIDGLFMAAGVMPPQKECETQTEKTIDTFNLNLTAITVILNLFANKFEEQKSGFISCLSSVAGDRGRQSNYIYGAAKAGLTAYLGGLRNRLHKHGILVQTVKPGFVKTEMTAHLDDSLLMVEPKTVAKDIVNGIEKKVDILYTPRFWRYIMSVIKVIPEPIFKRLSL